MTRLMFFESFPPFIYQNLHWKPFIFTCSMDSVVHGSYFMGWTNVGVERKCHLLLGYEAGWGCG